MRRRLPLLVVALAIGIAAIASLRSCGDDIRKYPADWPPLADNGRGCPELSGLWRLDLQDAGVLHRSGLFDDGGKLKAHWQTLGIAGFPGREWFLTFSANGRAARQIHVQVDPRHCEDGLLEVEREDTPEGWRVLRLGKDTQGGLVVARLEKSERLFSLQADNAGLPIGHVTTQSWGHWTLPTQATLDAARAPRNAPRPEGIPIGEVQARILAATPDNIVMRGVLPIGKAFTVWAHADDPRAIADFMQRLDRQGGFDVHPSSVGEVKPVNGNFTLELRERATP